MTFGIVIYDFLGEAIVWIIFALIGGVGFIYVIFKLFGWKTEADKPREMEQRGYHFLVAGVLLVCFIVGAGGYVTRWDRSRRSNVFSGERGSSGPPVKASVTTAATLERMWTSRTSGRVQSLALIRDRGNSPLEILVLAGRKILRLDAAGKKLGESVLATSPWRLEADQSGRVGIILAPSVKTHRQSWWQVADREDLTAFDVPGNALWTYSLPPNEATHMDPLLVDLDGDGEPDILVYTGHRIVRLDRGGKEEWSVVAPVLHWAAGDFDGDGKPDVLVVDSASTFQFLHDKGRLTPGWQMEGSPSNVFAAVMRPGSIASIATVSTALQMNAEGRMPQMVTIYSAKGELLGSSELPFNVMPQASPPFAALNGKGDGSRFWVLSASDNGLYFFSEDGSKKDVQFMDSNVRNLLAMPQPNGGDLLITGSEGSVTAWRLRHQPNFQR